MMMMLLMIITMIVPSGKPIGHHGAASVAMFSLGIVPEPNEATPSGGLQDKTALAGLCDATGSCCEQHCPPGHPPPEGVAAHPARVEARPQVKKINNDVVCL